MANKVTVAELLVEIGVDAKDAEKAAARLKDKLNKVGKAGERADKGVTKSEKALKRFAKAGKLANRVANGLGAALVGAAGAVAAIGKSVLTTGARFETLKIQLKTTTGSAEEADKAFKFIKDFAKNTPFQVDQITGAFVKLNNFGIEPTGRTMTAFGDFASAMGRSLDQMVEAVTDATVGEFERLKEFGIKTDARGEKIKFTFRGVTTEVEKNADDIKGFLAGLAEQNFGGAMAEQMGTAGGMVSNLMDAWAEFLNTVANLGPLEEFKGLVSDLQKAAGNKQGGLARLLADTLVKAIRGLRKLLKGNLVPTLERLLKVIEFVINNFGKLTAAFAAGKLVSGVAGLASAFGSLGLSIAAITGPVGIALAAITALGFAAVAVSRQISSIPKIPPPPGPDIEEEDLKLAPTNAPLVKAKQNELQALRRRIAENPALDTRGIRDQERSLEQQIGRLNEARRAEQSARAKASSAASVSSLETGGLGADESLRRSSARAEIRSLLSTFDEPTAGGASGDDTLQGIFIADDVIAKGGTVQDALAAIADAKIAEEEAAGFGVVGKRVSADTANKRSRGARKRREKDKKKRRPKSATTVSEFFAQAARGDLGPIADRTPSTREIEPTVAVDITNNNITMKADIKVEGVADPIAAAKSVAVQVRAEMGRAFAKAGQAMPSNVVR